MMTSILFFFHQELNPFGHPVSNAAAAFDHASEVGLGLLYRNAVNVCMLDVLKDICAFQKCPWWGCIPN